MISDNQHLETSLCSTHFIVHGLCFFNKSFTTWGLFIILLYHTRHVQQNHGVNTPWYFSHFLVSIKLDRHCTWLQHLQISSHLQNSDVKFTKCCVSTLTPIFPPRSIGGLLPIVFSYCSEFLCKADRSKYLSRLLIFWELGSLLVSLTAWAMLPKTGNTMVHLCYLSSMIYNII